MSDQTNGEDHCFQHQCQITPNISNGGELKQSKLVEIISNQLNKTVQQPKEVIDRTKDRTTGSSTCSSRYQATRSLSTLSN